MAEIKVVVSGTGRMGRETINAIRNAPDTTLVGVVEKFLNADQQKQLAELIDVPFGDDPASILQQTRPDVVVDFTNAQWAPVVMKATLDAGVRLITGTTGLNDAFYHELETRCREQKLGAVAASNFAIGAVLMMHMAKTAARFFDSAEIIELHHDGKADAPSGTALSTARGMIEAAGHSFRRKEVERESIPGTRGGDVQGIGVHAVRLPGLVAHQEVILGGLGETLTIRHDTIGRESFMPGVLLAVREVMKRRELVRGLDALIGLG